MFKNDRMMLILTGLVLAIFAGSMVQYGDRIMSMMAGEEIIATQDDSYSVRAGSSQILDVLSNDIAKGPIVVLTRPSCGNVEMSSNNRLSFSTDDTCNGPVEFAYCVDADGKCDPNAVKINVISVSFAQAEQTPSEETNVPAEAQPDPEPAIEREPEPAPETAVASATEPGVSPQPNTEAPEIATFSVEMAPPALAAPNMTELVSPGVAVASIRSANGGLNSASATDQNIAVQNTASINQTASAGPAAFSAPVIAESNNISLGGAERVVAAIPSQPSGLAASSVGGTAIVQLERGPEALDSLQIAQVAPISADVAPVSTSPEPNGNAPIFTASAKTNGPSLETDFSAQPNISGPIALIALNGTASRGNNTGESLNVILSEPGLQSFAAPTGLPRALAPAAPEPSVVSVMERGPNVEDQVLPPAEMAIWIGNLAQLSARNDQISVPRQGPIAISTSTYSPFVRADKLVAAAAPNQIAVPNEISNNDSVSRFISVSQNVTPSQRAANIAALSSPLEVNTSLPTIFTQAAEAPPIVEASLPVEPANPIVTAPPQNSTCGIALAPSVRSGATISLEITAGCKPNQMVTITHSGLEFSVLTDSNGTAVVDFPAMETEAEVAVRFEDQSSSSTTIAVRGMENIVRAGVTWQASMDLNLSAIEFGAEIGSEGHISAETPRDYRTSRIKGGGYLIQLGDPSLGRGALAEVYTLPISRNQQRGTIAMSVVIQDVAPVCGQTISAKTVRTREDRSAGIRNVRFTVPSCNTILSGPVALPGAIEDIRLAGR